MGGDLFSPGEGTAPRDRALRVAEIAALLRAAVEGAIGQVWIRGEVTGLKRYQSGHWYFTLRDPEAQVRCVMWRTYTQKAGSPPAEGTEVFILARPSLWEERGELRLSAVVVLPTAAVGSAERERERTRLALEQDGLLAHERKRPLPAFPRAVALVTSADGAVLHDVLTVHRRRWPLASVLIVSARVQGSGAVEDLVRALRMVSRLPVDLCLLARGGGSREDLVAFDDERVCRAVAAVPVPVISAVGHETDISLADLVADRRAPTPSAAAEMAFPDRDHVLSGLDHLADRLAQGLRRPTRLAQERLLRSGDRLTAAWSRRIERWERTVERHAAQLEALSPLRVLERGYAVAQGADGRVLRRVADLAPAMPFTLRLADGAVAARVDHPGGGQ